MRQTASSVIAAVLLVACNGTETVDPPVTTTVIVAITPSQVSVNENAQASATARDQNGATLAGKTATWTSLNPSVATVNSTSGQVTGVAAGSATIQGTIDGINGTATITVVAPVQSCAGGPTNVTMNPGEVRTISVAAVAGCIRITSTGTAPSEYLVIAANANFTPDALSSYALRSDTGEVVPSNSVIPDFYRLQLSQQVAREDDRSALQLGFERRLRARERAELPFAAAKRLHVGREGAPRFTLTAPAPAAVVVGEQAQIKVPVTAAGTGGGCGANSFTTITATVRYISTRAVIYTDDASPSGGFSDAEFQEIATEFDNLIYPTDVDHFGTPSDLDSNQRIAILYTPQVNRLTPANNPSGFVGGFFFAGDMFPVSSCPQSNLREIMYLLAPDPQGTINGNVRTTATVRQGTRGTIAHEFVHLINASERFRNPAATTFESTWLDEGMAHMSEDVNGRILKGLGETANLTREQLLTGANASNDYNAFFFQNFARFMRYLANPGVNAPTSRFADSSLADRGAAWALLRYAADHHVTGDTKSFLRALSTSADTGVVNFRNRINAPFDTVIAGWMVTNFTEDAGIAGLPARYSYKTYNLRNIISQTNTPSQLYPLVATEISGTGVLLNNLQARSASGNYFRFSRLAGAPARSFRFLNTDLQAAASFTGATYYIVRLQ